MKAIKISLAFNVMVYHRSGSFVLERLWKALKKATSSSHHHMTFTDWRMQGHLTEKNRTVHTAKIPLGAAESLKKASYILLYVPFRVHSLHEHYGVNMCHLKHLHHLSEIFSRP